RLVARKRARRDEPEIRQPHRLHRARARADVARMRGFDENDADRNLHEARGFVNAVNRELSPTADYSTLRPRYARHGQHRYPRSPARRRSDDSPVEPARRPADHG